MSRAKKSKIPWKEFERELSKAIAEDKKMTKRQQREYQAWLDSLPEYVPVGTGHTVKVIFFGADKSSRRKKQKE